MKKFYRLLLAGALLAGITGNAQTKKQLKPEDYGKWQSLGATAISNNGAWLAWQMMVQKDNDSLFLENLLTKKKYAIAFASGPVFSGDNQWIAYRVGVSYKESEKLEEQKKPVEYSTGYMNLVTGRQYSIKNAGRFSFSENGKFLAITLDPAKGNTEKGSILLLRNLTDSTTRTIGNVTASAFNKKGDFLAYVIEGANDAANSVELFNLNTYALKVLASDTCRFSQLTWQKKGDALCFMKTVKSPDHEEETGVIYTYTNVYKTPALTLLSNSDLAGLPKDMRIVPTANIGLSEDITSVFFGLNKWTEKPKKDTAKKAPAAKDSTRKDSAALVKAAPKKDSSLKNPSGLDIWHWKDEEIQPRQKLTYNQDKNANFLGVYNFDKKNFIQVADSVFPRASIGGKQKIAVVMNDTKYKPAFKEDYADFYLVDLKTGTRKLLGEKKLAGYYTGFNSSPDGKYLTYFADQNWWVYDVQQNQHRNLSGGIKTDFWNTKDDHPATKPPFGMAGWTKGDKDLLVYDEYNIYALQADGKKTRKLTSGEKDEIVFRIVRTDAENEYFDETKPIILSAYGDKTKRSGFYQLNKGQVQELVYADKAMGRLTKAKDADVYAYLQQTFSESPSVVAVNGDWKKSTVVATTNPQQKDYAWGKSELVNFTNKKGQQLQGALFYPADYQPGKKYPMVVYIYEILSNTLHGYTSPNERSAYNTTNFTTNGYFIFRPDIVYDINEPGMSAVNCVVPAVEEVLKTGMIDENKVGLMGHSWGAYQTSFIITQTNLFKAAIAGAPLTDLISMSMSIYWNSGVPDQKIFETSQGRFDGPWYDRMEEHIRNSPMFQAKNINTPLMVAFGDKDGAVDWHQGIEMYGTLRRMQKPHIMLVYADENHGLAKKENQIDYQKRQFEFFDHYLLGKPAPKWIEEGVKYTEKMKK